MASVSNVEFRVDDASYRALQKILNPKQLQKALQVAVIRTTKAAMKIASKAVREVTTIPQKYIADDKNRYAAIKSHIVNYTTNPTGYVVVRDITLPMSAFKFTASKKAGVTVDFGLHGKYTFRHMFVARVQSARQEQLGTSHLGLFTRSKGRNTQRRRGEKYEYRGKTHIVGMTPKGYAWRLPINEHFGPSVLDYISGPQIKQAIESKIGNELQKQVDSQVSRFTQGKFTTLADAKAVMDMAETSSETTDNA